MIDIVGLSKRYDGADAVDSLSMEIPDGQFTVLLGPSGSGKTTILRMLNRMVTPTSGTITVDGTDILSVRPEQLRRTMGYVIQSIGLFPNMTVSRNVATVPRLLGWDRDRMQRRVDEMLELVGLDPSVYGPKRPSQLSGGEAQRVGVARALAADPPILLMDEPFGAVDPLTRERLQLELRRLHSVLGKTIVFVTHDIDEAVLLADRIALVRKGRLEQYDTPEALWKRPASDFVRGFMGESLGLRVMGRLRLCDVVIDPSVDDDMPVVDREATLRDALATLVNSRAPRLAVRDGDLKIGSVGFEDLLRILDEDPCGSDA